MWFWIGVLWDGGMLFPLVAETLDMLRSIGMLPNFRRLNRFRRCICLELLMLCADGEYRQAGCLRNEQLRKFKGDVQEEV